MPAPTPPRGFRFDAFADARMGRSLFQMQPEDWLVRDDAPMRHRCATCGVVDGHQPGCAENDPPEDE